MKRSKGSTFLAILFIWLSIGGGMYAWSVTQVPAEQLAAFHLQPRILQLIGGLYAATAAAVAIGFWKIADWTPRAVLAWGLVLFVMLAALQSMIGVAGEPWWLVATPYLVFAAIAYSIYRYAAKASGGRAPAI